MKKLKLIWSLLLTIALFFSIPQTAFAHYMDQAYEEEMFCDEEEEPSCNRSLWIGGGVLGLATIGAIACAITKNHNHNKSCHHSRCCNEVPDNGGGGEAIPADFIVNVNGITLSVTPPGTTIIFTLVDPNGATRQESIETPSIEESLSISIPDAPLGPYRAILTFRLPPGETIQFNETPAFLSVDTPNITPPDQYNFFPLAESGGNVFISIVDFFIPQDTGT